MAVMIGLYKAGGGYQPPSGLRKALCEWCRQGDDGLALLAIRTNQNQGTSVAKRIVDESTGYREVVKARGREVVRIEADALTLLAKTLDESFVAACELILATRGRVIVTGMGKSGHIARKVAATLAATGTPAFFVHPAEAAHGDMGMLVKDDTLVVMSNSGNTAELHAIVHYAGRIGAPLIGVASRRDSLVIRRADVALLIPSTREACAANIAPTTSTTLQLALGDAIAMAVMDMRGVTRDSLRALHPAGSIGLRLTPVTEVMHDADRLPIVAIDAQMPDVISVMTSGGFGIAGVVDARGTLVGVITDGDLRRHFAELGTATAAQIMTHSPKTLSADMLAEDALLYLNTAEITAAFVFDAGVGDAPARPVGIVHIHDFLRFGFS